MIHVNSLVGARTDPVLHERLHQLEHHDAVETVTIPTSDLDRRRQLHLGGGFRHLAAAHVCDQHDDSEGSPRCLAGDGLLHTGHCS